LKVERAVLFVPLLSYFVVLGSLISPTISQNCIYPVQNNAGIFTLEVLCCVVVRPWFRSFTLRRFFREFN